jgi:hypothetical protein
MTHSRARVLWLRGGVLALAAVLRFVGIGFAPSTPWGRPDEEIFATAALRLFTEASPHTAETGWPEGWFRVHYAVQVVLRALWSWTYGVDPDLGCVMVISPSRLLVPVRIAGALLSVATVWLVMRLARRVGPRTLSDAERETVSLVAGLVMAVDVLAARDAHYAVSDSALVFLVAWVLLAAARGLDEGRVIDFASCGVALGLAIGTKWTGLAFGIVPVVALAIRFRRFGAHPSNAMALMVGTASVAAAFLLTNPTFRTGAQPFLDGLAGQAVRYDPNAPQVFTIYERAIIEFGLTRHLRVSLPFAFGWPLSLVAIAGTFALVWPRKQAWRSGGLLVALLTIVFHVVVAGRTTMYFARYSLPIHPGLAVAAGLAIVMAARAIASWCAKDAAARLTLGHRMVWISTLLLVVEPTLRTIDFDLVFSRPETRDVAREYLHEHVGDAPIGISGGYSRQWAITPSLADRCEARLPPGLRSWVPRTASGADALSDGTPASWPTMSHQAIIGSLHGPHYAGASEWSLVALPYLPCDQPVQRFGAALPGVCDHEVARFEPSSIECSAMWDDQDHLYAPLWGWSFGAPFFAGAHTPLMGPQIVLYHHECPPPAP